MKDGKVEILHPSRHFPEAYGSMLQLLDVLRRKLDSDREFALRWYGYVLLPVNIGDGVVVNSVPDLKAEARPWRATA